VLITLPNGNLVDPETITEIRYRPAQKRYLGLDASFRTPDELVIEHGGQDVISYPTAAEAIAARDDLGRVVSAALVARHEDPVRESIAGIKADLDAMKATLSELAALIDPPIDPRMRTC
jgi:hypothetical protein